MKNLKTIIFITSFIFISSLIIPTVFSKSYSYDSIKVDLYLQQNGSVYVKQERDYNFQGSFTYAYVDFLKKYSQGIKILNITDLDSPIPISFNVQEDSDSVKVTWYYSANNQVKRFLIEYIILGPVKRYEDVAEFYWKVIEDSHESIDNLDINIHLSAPSSSLFKVFIHSSANPGEIKFSDQYTEALVSMENIPSNTFVEARVLTSPQIFPNAQQTNAKKYESILNEEKGNFIVYGAYGFFSSIFFIIFLALVPAFLFIFLYLKYGREPKVEYDLKYEHDPPNDIPPMALSNLMEGEEFTGDIKREAMGLLATIFDLARRGYLKITEKKEKKLLGLYESTEQVFTLTKKGMNSKERKKLENFEEMILDFVFSCGKNPNEVTSSDISKYCRLNGYDVEKEIKKIDKLSRNWFEKNYFKITDEKSSRVNKNFTYFVIAYIFFMLSYFIAIFGLNIVFGFTLILIIASSFLSFICLIFSIANIISRRTHESALEVQRWKAFKRFMADFSAMEEAPATLLHIWDKYLVYAITLGVAKKLLENIKKLAVEKNVTIAAVAWYHGSTPSSGVMDIRTMSTFIDSLSNTVSALSSSTSVGGGFSGGGGGGGGGGGSGAG